MRFNILILICCTIFGGVSCSSGQLNASAESSNTIFIPQVTSNGNWWQPNPGTPWQWQLTGEMDTSLDVQMFDLDLFDLTEETVTTLHDAGKIVICYFSAGSWEDWRPDKDDFPVELLGNHLEDWPDERWLDIRALDDLGPVMSSRLDLAVEKDCDGVEPDNVDGYTNNSGFPLDYDDQIIYNTWLASQAHQRGLSIGLKNDLDQVGDLYSLFDWALNEECNIFNECELLLPFVQSGKAVFGVEYDLSTADFCPQMNALNFDFMRKNWDLDAWREACREY